jgi:hypothetical protein
MATSDYIELWHKALAQELCFLVQQSLGLKLGRQHTIELIAACHNMDAAGLSLSGMLASLDPVIPNAVPWEFVTRRILKTAPEMSAEQVAVIHSVLARLWDEESQPQLAFAKRLARIIATNCDFFEGEGYVGSVFLLEEDWLACGQIATRDDFLDGLAEQLPWPSIVPISQARPERLYDGFYQVEPGCILNVLAFLRPDDWEDLLSRHRM